MAEPVVELRGVTKKIHGKTIIDRLSFDVPRGEVFGFLGPNGAGKTTTIRMMVGLMGITEGEIRIGGHSITREFERAIRHVGAIVENPEMYKYMSGYDNLVHYARMMPGISRQRIDEVVRLVGLEKRIRDKVRTYSLGMRQRLGVAQAILHKPALLILDEPTNGLDPAGIRELRDYLRKLARDEGTSVLVSSHLLSEMELMCDRVAIIQNGRLIDVRPIAGWQGDGGDNPAKAAILFEIEPEMRERAARIAEQTVPECGAAVHGEGIEARLARQDVANVNSALVQAGIDVFGIRTVTKSLEDTFLEMTGSDQIA